VRASAYEHACGPAATSDGRRRDRRLGARPSPLWKRQRHHRGARPVRLPAQQLAQCNALLYGRGRLGGGRGKRRRTGKDGQERPSHQLDGRGAQTAR
jgi:hypothetical protein